MYRAGRPHSGRRYAELQQTHSVILPVQLSSTRRERIGRQYISRDDPVRPLPERVERPRFLRSDRIEGRIHQGGNRSSTTAVNCVPQLVHDCCVETSQGMRAHSVVSAHQVAESEHNDRAGLRLTCLHRIRTDLRLSVTKSPR